ncbi:MAG TPA: prepilin-type N-terminal cleavage/methylation domain-containing protein [Tepidisphaeraceae bacterium]|nr:prepilin-type N-terminal cleavage/methylation domain-containing protein [Tepidisphaeraceae bacterium]
MSTPIRSRYARRRPRSPATVAAAPSGFTLVELLVVIGIIAILIAMTVIGIRKMAASTRAKATVATLATAHGMLSEYERIAQSGSGLPKKMINTPKSVLEGSADRDGQAVQDTRVAMGLVLGIPVNRKAIEQLPPTGLLQSNPPGQPPVLLDAWGNPVIFVPAGGLNGVLVNGKATRITSLDNLPFFASAGADGSFETGDDNVYSFDR